MSDTLFFLAAKLVGLLIRPDIWLALCVLLSAGLVWSGRGRVMVLVTAGYVLLLGLFPLGDFILGRLEARYPATPEISDPTGIIVLGGGEHADPARRWGGVQMNQAGERFTDAMALARRFPEAQLVFTGGSGALRQLGQSDGTQAGIAEALFLSLGLPAERLTLEARSRNTAENASLTYDLVRPGPGETWVLVTSAFHMPRAMASFDAAGWPGLVAWPVDYRSVHLRDGLGWNLDENLEQFRTAVKETVGLLAYDLAER